MNAQFQVGNRVVDRDGYKGTIQNVTHYNGSVWYDVRFDGGVAVRYDSDLTLSKITVARASGRSRRPFLVNP